MEATVTCLHRKTKSARSSHRCAGYHALGCQLIPICRFRKQAQLPISYRPIRDALRLELYLLPISQAHHATMTEEPRLPLPCRTDCPGTPRFRWRDRRSPHLDEPACLRLSAPRHYASNQCHTLPGNRCLQYQREAVEDLSSGRLRGRE